MSASIAQRWTFTQPSPIGDVTSTYELTPEGLRFRTDAPLGDGTDLLRWDSIAEAATAAADLPAHKGGPDMASWIPGRLEWLLVSHAAAGKRAFMRPLPAGDARNAIVAALRVQLGPRWVGEGLALPAAQKRFPIAARGETLKVAGLVLAVMCVLCAMIVLFTLAASVLYLPVGFLLGGWFFRRGLIGARDALQMANTPTAKVLSAALGRVELEGRAVTDQPVPAGVSGRPSVWWDVAVDVYYDDRDDGGWKQVMARHGGSADTLLLEDDTGRVPVWLRDADLLLAQHCWESGKDTLPSGGVALLDGTAFDWRSGKRLRVRETRMEAGASVYVFGTLDEARHLPAAGEEGIVAQCMRSLRTGEWRAKLLRVLPALLRAPIGVALMYVDMLFSVGRGGERALGPQDAAVPAMSPSSLLVWKGRSGHSLIVSDHRESAAIEHLRKRSLWSIGIGAAALCWCLYELITLF